MESWDSQERSWNLESHVISPLLFPVLNQVDIPCVGSSTNVHTDSVLHMRRSPEDLIRLTRKATPSWTPEALKWWNAHFTNRRYSEKRAQTQDYHPRELMNKVNWGRFNSCPETELRCHCQLRHGQTPATRRKTCMYDTKCVSSLRPWSKRKASS